MIIENVEALRIWLTEKLKPICDADPSALAKYVVALLKKEKPLKELQDVCMDQLDVFLGDDTKVFVSKLFEALEDQSYLPSNQLQIKPGKEGAEEPVKDASGEDKNPEVVVEEKEEIVPEVVQENNEEEPSKEEEVKEDKTEPSTSQHLDANRKRRSTGEHGHRQRNWRRGRENLASSFDHSGVKRARNDLDRSMARGRPERSVSPFARRSPRRSSPPGRRHRPRRDRRRRSEERRGYKKRGRCRDYEEKGFCLLGESCPFDHGRDPVIVDDHRLPGMLRLPVLPGPVPPQIGDLFPGVGPLSGSNVIANHTSTAGISSMGLRLDTGLTMVPGQQRPVTTPSEMPVKMPVLAEPKPALASIKPAVNDVKEKGEESSKKTGAKDPALQSNGNEAYNPEEPSIDVTEPATVPVWIAQHQKSFNKAQPNSIYNMPATYPPTSMTAEEFLRKMYTPSSLHPAQAPLQPLANTFPPVLHPPPGMPPMAMMSSGLTPTVASKTGQLSSYNQPRRPFMNQTILEVRKIPKENNTAVKISEYFQKFGTIVNIQVQYEKDPQAALVQFSNNMEARRAYSSPEAVLGNRFIKLFWHNKSKDFPVSNAFQLPTGEGTAVSTTSGNVAKTSSTGADEEAGGEKPRLPAANQTTYVNPENTPQAVQRKQVEAKKEALKKKLEIQKQRQSLLEKQIKEQKVLITKLEKNKSMSATEKSLLMNALKTLTTSIDKIRNDISSQQSKPAKKLSKQAMQKEQLDREIELYNKQFAGFEEALDAKKSINDVDQEGKFLDNMKSKLVAHGVRGGRGRGRGRGRGQLASRGKGHTVSRAVVDNRPRQILVTGYDEVDKDAVVAQFAGFGEIDRVEEKPGGKLVLSFHTRKQAEIAATKAAVFQGKKLVLAWYNASQNAKRNVAPTDAPIAAKIPRRSTRSSSVSSLLSKDDKEEEDLLGDLDDKETDLLLLEEDEEEDLEERSWKR
eukprot:gene7433-8255_t